MSGKDWKVNQQRRKVHPLVQATYWPRIGGFPLIALMVLSRMEDRSFFALPMLLVALVWPQIAHLLGTRLRHRRAPFHVLLADFFISGAFIGLSGLAWTETGAWLLVMGGWSVMVGGPSFLLQGLLSSLAGLTTTLSFTPIDLWVAPRPVTVAFSAAWLTFAFVFSSYLVNATTRRLVSIRHDLRARNEELSRKSKELRGALDDAANIAELTRIVNATLDSNEVIEKAIGNLMQDFHINQVMVGIVEEGGDYVRLQRHYGSGFDTDLLAGLSDFRLPLDESRSFVARTITRNHPVYLPRIGAEQLAEMSPADRDLYDLNPARALVVFPLEFEGSVIGMIYFGHTESEFDLSEEELTKIQRYVVQISTAIRNARLFEEVKEARAAAESANATKSQFLANMSHELRTPMNAIIGYSEMLMEDAEEAGDEQTMEDLAKIRTAGKHLLALINDVLDLSKIEAGKMTFSVETFDLSDLIESVVTTIQPLVDANRNRLETVLPETAGTMETDETRVRQALFNLLSNACKFTQDGTVSLEVERRGSPGAERVVFTVRDSGIGMTTEQVEKAFDEFTQADLSTQQQFGGTGLGLPISRRFARMMGGDITGTSKPGQGSTFSLELPARATKPRLSGGVTTERPVGESTLPEPGTAVLVVDDDPSALDLNRRILEREGFRVVAADSGTEGLELARLLNPIAIVLDILMPEVDGWEVLASLKESVATRNIPVILASVLDAERRGLALGAADFISKPIDSERLAGCLRNLRARASAGRALIVECESTSRKLIREVLEQERWEVAEAQNRDEALQRLEVERPNLIIVDLTVTESGSFDLMEDLARIDPTGEMEVVALAARSLDPEERNRLESASELMVRDGVGQGGIGEQVAALVKRYARPARQ
jgi:signal transduction histidine kinase/CheY-like chemotaxis protein